MGPYRTMPDQTELVRIIRDNTDHIVHTVQVHMVTYWTIQAPYPITKFLLAL